jgi:hypothetical protein
VNRGLGTKLSPRPRRHEILGGGGIIVQRSCTAEFVQRTKNCDLGMLAMMWWALRKMEIDGFAANPKALVIALSAWSFFWFASSSYLVLGQSCVVGSQCSCEDSWLSVVDVAFCCLWRLLNRALDRLDLPLSFVDRFWW